MSPLHLGPFGNVTPSSRIMLIVTPVFSVGSELSPHKLRLQGFRMKARPHHQVCNHGRGCQPCRGRLSRRNGPHRSLGFFDERSVLGILKIGDAVKVGKKASKRSKDSEGAGSGLPKQEKKSSTIGSTGFSVCRIGRRSFAEPHTPAPGTDATQMDTYDMNIIAMKNQCRADDKASKQGLHPSDQDNPPSPWWQVC